MRLCERVVNNYEHITFGPRDRVLIPRDVDHLLGDPPSRRFPAELR
jgi:hypothetical protein